MHTIILYNPNSTGDSKANALELQSTLKKMAYPANVQPTKYAGHAEEIAASYAKTGKEILIISSSGDGGYHEVINGALSHKQSKVITSLLPSGNANDHHTAVSSGTLAENIARGVNATIDVLEVQGTIDGKPWIRYAHSYIGIGISAKAAHDLTVQRPNFITEKFLVIKSFILLKPVKILAKGAMRRYNSMVFSNIDTMSKMMKLSRTSSITDGKMEFNAIGNVSKIRLAQYIIQATTKGLREHASLTSYSFTTIKPLFMQLDGEVVTLDACSDVTITCAPKKLRCVL